MQKLDTKRIVELANHIANNQIAIPEQEAVEIVANHIRNFWHSSMVNLLLDANDEELHPYCVQAKRILS